MHKYISHAKANHNYSPFSIGQKTHEHLLTSGFYLQWEWIETAFTLGSHDLSPLGELANLADSVHAFLMSNMTHWVGGGGQKGIGKD